MLVVCQRRNSAVCLLSFYNIGLLSAVSAEIYLNAFFFSDYFVPLNFVSNQAIIPSMHHLLNDNTELVVVKVVLMEIRLFLKYIQ